MDKAFYRANATDIVRDNNGFYRAVAAVCPVEIGNPMGNAEKIISVAEEASKMGAGIIVFPELCITGYTCADLFNQELLLQKTEEAIIKICDSTLSIYSVIVIGAPVAVGDSLYNCALVISEGTVKGIVPKRNLPNYGEFYEKRWFAPASKASSVSTIKYLEGEVPFGTDLIFQTGYGVKFGIEICEDLWVPNAPSVDLALNGADIILNLSASDELLGKHRYLRNLILQQSATLRCGYIYASAGAGESSTDLTFSGNLLLAENGRMLKESERFQRGTQIAVTDFDIEQLRHDRRVYNSFGKESTSPYRVVQTALIEVNIDNIIGKEILRDIDPRPFVPNDRGHLRENCEEIVSIQSWGLEQRLLATGCKTLVVGISGGLDSTLALLVACHAFDRLGLSRKGIIGITMPGEATTSRTKGNADGLMECLGVDAREIPIGKAVAQHFSDIGQDPNKHDAAYENSQARERTQILMDVANKEGGMVLGTGDLSELALGWCTYNGDHMSMYGVNASVPKTLVKYLVGWFAESTDNEKEHKILLDIIDTPISPELIPADNEDKIAQKTEDLIGPYELHDFFLYHTLRHGSRPAKVYRLALQAFKGVYPEETIGKWLLSFYRRFFTQQFKRSCMPDGPKVGSVCLSPRGDWRMPSDACSKAWIEETRKVLVEEDIKKAVATMRKGGIILYPTDTVWGIGCDSSNAEAVAKIYRLKRREDSKSMLVLAGDISQLRDTVESLPRGAMGLISESERPLTVIYDHPRGVAENLKAEDGSLGIRVSGEEFSSRLCLALGKPVVSTSANISGERPASNYDEISEEILSGVDYVCFSRRDEKSDGVPSSIVKITDEGVVTKIR